jgi:hypothetical protein
MILAISYRQVPNIVWGPCKGIVINSFANWINHYLTDMNAGPMKRGKLYVFHLLVLFIGPLSGKVLTQQTAQIFSWQPGYLISLPDGYPNDTAKKWPLLLFLHGSGEWGTDIEKVKVSGPPKLVAAGKHCPFIIVSPQAQDPDIGWEPEDLHRFLVYIKQNYRVDDTRIYLPGLSMGDSAPGRLSARNTAVAIRLFSLSRQKACIEE